MKRILFITMMLLLIILILVSISNINLSMKDLEENPPRIVLLTKMKYGDYWKMVRLGAQSAAKEFGVELIFDAPEKEDDIDGQIALLDYYNSMKVDGIVLASSDYNLLVDKVDEVFSEKIPLILIDSKVNTQNYIKSFSTDNYRAGQQAGEQVVKFSGENSTVGIISFVKGSENAMQREKGIRDYLANYPGIKILETEYCISNSDIAASLTKLLVYNKDADVVVGLNAIATIGIGEALEKDKAAIAIGFDTSLEIISYVDRGIIEAVIVQNPFGMGYLGVKHAYYGYDSKLDDKDIAIDSLAITKDNMFLPENQKLVFPFSSE